VWWYVVLPLLAMMMAKKKGREEKNRERDDFSLFSPLDYIWRRNPCMEAKIKKRIAARVLNS